MNTILCHRDYTGNGPVQFYQYDDRIEILNPGGLYGKATPENFPRVNDYRNPVIAEGMRVLGYVNRYSWGVSEVRDKLEENGNGLPEFDLDLVTAFLVKEKISPRGMEARRYAIEQGYLVEENQQKPSQVEENSATNGGKSLGMEENESKTSTDEGKTPITIPSYRGVYEAIKLNRKIKFSQLGDNLGLGETTIFRAIAWLKENGYINPERSKVKGEWQLL